MKEITEKLMEKTLDMVNQNVQDACKKFQDSINKKPEKTQKQLNELREDFNKSKVKQRKLFKKREIGNILRRQHKI
jgi:hypothetical protein